MMIPQEIVEAFGVFCTFTIILLLVVVNRLEEEIRALKKKEDVD